jgi:hypothetical protein
MTEFLFEQYSRLTFSDRNGFVIGGVHANRLERLGIFGQAFFLETRNGEFAAKDVT